MFGAFDTDEHHRVTFAASEATVLIAYRHFRHRLVV
jgi:hypothetical protein